MTDKELAKLEALAAFPEIAHYHQKALTYQDATGYVSRPSYARPVGLATFSLPKGGFYRGESDVTGLVVVGRLSWNVAREVTDRVTPEQRSAWGIGDDDAVSLITDARNWHEAAPYRAADAVRDERDAARQAHKAKARDEATARARNLQVLLGLDSADCITDDGFKITLSFEARQALLRLLESSAGVAE